MNATEFDRHTFPPGGWQFLQPQTGWRSPAPTSNTFDQTVRLIIKHRQGNPAITAKHKLSLNTYEVGEELETFTRTRLGITMLPKQPPLRSSSQSVGAAAAGDKNSVAFGIKRAAMGSAVVLDWLTSGGKPVEQDLANRRAAVCVKCPKNVPGSWYTTAPAEIIRATLSARSDLKLETEFDKPGVDHPGLLSCDVCKCLNRLKVWCPMDHIVARTNPEIMKDFPGFCWIAKRDQ